MIGGGLNIRTIKCAFLQSLVSLYFRWALGVLGNTQVSVYNSRCCRPWSEILFGISAKLVIWWSFILWSLIFFLTVAASRGLALPKHKSILNCGLPLNFQPRDAILHQLRVLLHQFEPGRKRKPRPIMKESLFLLLFWVEWWHPLPFLVKGISFGPQQCGWSFFLQDTLQWMIWWARPICDCCAQMGLSDLQFVVSIISNQVLKF